MLGNDEKPLKKGLELRLVHRLHTPSGHDAAAFSAPGPLGSRDEWRDRFRNALTLAPKVVFDVSPMSFKTSFACSCHGLYIYVYMLYTYGSIVSITYLLICLTLVRLPHTMM